VYVHIVVVVLLLLLLLLLLLFPGAWGERTWAAAKVVYGMKIGRRRPSACKA